MATSFADIEADARGEDRRHELWLRWRRSILLVVGTVMATALVVWANWFLQRYVILGDDTARGEHFREALDVTEAPTGRQAFVYAQCKIAAEAFYGHGLLDGDPGYAPPNEKAFFVACSGTTVGGRGGGQGD
jgi:hypothetical protein